MGVDQSTLEALINDNKDNDGAEQGFADGATLYTSGGTSSLVFQQLATNTDFFRSQQTGNFFASFQKYVDYFGGDETYMDVTCLAGFNGGDADFTAGGGDLWQYSVYDAFGRAGACVVLCRGL